MSLSIHPLFVFDGPNRPEFKRNKRVGGGKAQVASIPEFLAKQLLKQFGFPYHLAPGEAEAECASLQRAGIVDAVLSEDVDTLMFGSGTTIKNWSPSEGSKSKTPTHVDLYDAVATKNTSGLDRNGMILVAMMSGGDYITEGIPGVGPKLACEAARAGFGEELCSLRRTDLTGLKSWKEKLQHELKTNESKFFRTKHAAITIPEDFPNMNVLHYYTNPVISSNEKLDRLRASLEWDLDVDCTALRAFTADAFSWTNLGGAKHFIRNLAVPMLVRELRMRGQRPESTQLPTETEQEEAKLVHSIHGRRTHVTTDQTSEMRVAFRPIDLVPIDLEAEEPDDQLPEDEEAENEGCGDDLLLIQAAAKPRAPTKYDPIALEKAWILETYVRVGAPLKVQDWEQAYRDPKKYLAMKHANKAAGKTKKANDRLGGTQPGALDRFVKISKLGAIPAKLGKGSTQRIQESSSQPFLLGTGLLSAIGPHDIAESDASEPATISLLSSSPPRETTHQDAVIDLPPTVTKRRRRSPLRRTQTSPASLFQPVTQHLSPDIGSRLGDLGALHNSVEHASPSPALISKKLKTTATRPVRSSNRQPKTGQQQIVLSSSPQRTIDTWVRRSQSVTPTKAKSADQRSAALPNIPETSTLEQSRLEIRTAWVDDDTTITRTAIAQIDLTDLDACLDLPLSKRQFPQPYSHLKPSDLARMEASLNHDGPSPRRRWDKWAVLAETSGNGRPPRRELKQASNTVHAPASEPQAPAMRKPPEKLFVEVDGMSEGFWQEAPASRLKKGAVKASGRKHPPGVLVWALDDVDVVDLTRST